MNKYTPPPRFKGQNADRGISKNTPEPKPLSNQFPVKEGNIVNPSEINPDTNQPYIRIWTPD